MDCTDDHPPSVEPKSRSLKIRRWGTEKNGAMSKHQQFSKFEKYVKSRERKIKRALSEIEKRGAAAALDKCSVLAEQIDGDLRNKKRRHLFTTFHC
jgi:hypothetical protein